MLLSGCKIRTYIFKAYQALLGMFLAIRPTVKIAVPEWQGRVSPVFDVASKVLLVEIEDNRELQRQEDTLGSKYALARARALRDMGVDVLICGAVSWPLEVALRSVGIKVICNICGPVEAVLAAFRNGRLDERVFLMPGCYRRRRRFRGGGRRGRSWQ